MTNKLKGEAALILEDGRRFTLVLDFDALIEAEATYRKPLDQMMADAKSGFRGSVRALLFAALRRNHPKLTIGDATEMVRDHLEAVVNAISDALAASLPDESEGDDAGNAAADPESDQAGNSSGSNGAKPD